MDDFEEKLRELDEEFASSLGMDIDCYRDCVRNSDGYKSIYFDEEEEMGKLLEYMGIGNVLNENDDKFE